MGAWGTTSGRATVSVVAGDGRTTLLLSSRSLPELGAFSCGRRQAYLFDSFCLDEVFFLFGEGILHSMLKATQLVQGTPRLAASQRTWETRQKRVHREVWASCRSGPFARGMSIASSQHVVPSKPKSWSYLASSRGALSAMVASVSVQRLYRMSCVAYLRKLVAEAPCWLMSDGDA
jgi:hypothetical protein